MCHWDISYFYVSSAKYPRAHDEMSYAHPEWGVPVTKRFLADSTSTVIHYMQQALQMTKCFKETLTGLGA